MSISTNYSFPTSTTTTTASTSLDVAGQAGASSASSTLGSTVGYLQAAQNVYAILNSDASATEKIQGVREAVAITVADAYTGGLASVAYGFANKYFPGVMQSIRDFDAKFNVVTRVLGGLLESNKWKVEGDRMRSLMEKGISIPESLQGATQLTRGRTKEELVDLSVPLDFTGYRADGQWVNNNFAMGREESQLAPEDIWGYSAFFERFGNDWLGSMTEGDRRAIAQRALDLGTVSEHHGTIDIEWTPDLVSFADSLKRATA